MIYFEIKIYKLFIDIFGDDITTIKCVQKLNKEAFV